MNYFYYVHSIFFFFLIFFSYQSICTSIEYLYMPWRDTYGNIINEPAHNHACPLCAKCQMDPEQSFMLGRTKYFAITLNRFPYSKGHLLIFPLAHIAELNSLNKEALLELMELSIKSSDILKAILKCQGINIGMNLGPRSGASIVDHIHMHIVPRYASDHESFLTITAQTRPVMWNMAKLHEDLKPYFENL